MYKRFVFICIVLAAAIAAMTAIGAKALRMQEQGLHAERQGQFAAVAEQIRLDVKQKLDAFISEEQKRPYTDYQPYYIPQAENRAAALLKSPLAETPPHSLAAGYFQLDDKGQITLPYRAEKENLLRLEKNLLPALTGQTANREIGQTSPPQPPKPPAPLPEIIAYEKRSPAAAAARPEQTARKGTEKTARYKIESLQETQQQVQTLQQPRENVMMNVGTTQTDNLRTDNNAQADEKAKSDIQNRPPDINDNPHSSGTAETVQIRIEPLTPVPVAADKDAIFGSRILIIRHVQIEQNHFVQGFELNQKELLEQIKDSARRFIRKGMGFDLSEKPDAAYTAVLDFGFGELPLSLLELDSGWTGRQTSRLHNWFNAIVGIVLLAVTLAMAGLWKNLSEHLKLSRKKDDFLSAVSHELRTPLTSIRMYTEMLEKNWVASEEKRKEYYTGMRQETERLSRLIENVLDFSRIQKGRKHYNFVVGDLNGCIENAVKMMRPYAGQEDFALNTDFEQIEPFMFDRDAVMQIAVNLIDNAVKYARPSADSVITIRTRRRNSFAVLEVEDHGPGIPKNQQARIFEAFYRCGDESTRQAQGTGLGLALVKKFAQAHRGFVEVIGLKPGTVLRVGLALA